MPIVQRTRGDLHIRSVEVEAHESLALSCMAGFFSGFVFGSNGEVSLVADRDFSVRYDGCKHRCADDADGRGDSSSGLATRPFPHAQCGTSRVGDGRLATQPTLQIIRKCSSGTVALGGLFRHRLQRDFREVFIRIFVDRSRVRRFVRCKLAKDRERVRADEWRAASELVIQQRTEPIHIRKRRRGSAATARLLGSHVGRRAEARAGECEALCTAKLRETEVADHRRIVRIKEDVCGLQIAMEHAVFVGELHGVRDVQEQRRSGAVCDGSWAISERPIRELHYEKGHAFKLTDLIHRDHIWVLQPRRSLSFLAEAP